MKTNQLKITYQKTGDLVPYARNSRTHSEEQVGQIAASITEFGFTNPVLVDEENTIIAGHGRIMAAQKLGMVEVPTITLSGLTESQRKAYIIADNRLALNAGWDDEMLRLEIADLKKADFDLDLLGFDNEELEKEKETEKPDIILSEVFEVVAECSNESEQEMVYNILNSKGIKCRLSTL
jgi:ParB-like chromosome segregation protein Spo0J